MNYPKCSLATIIDPGTYIVVSGDGEHCSQIEFLEDVLTEKMRQRKGNLRSYDLKPQLLVAVEISGKEIRFKRGRIEKKLRRRQYKVFLIDSGCFVDVDESKIQVMTNEDMESLKDLIEMEPLSFTVELYGLVPAEFYLKNGIRRQKICQNWCPESFKFVEGIFEMCNEIRVRSIFIRKRTVYGDLYLTDYSKEIFRSLRKLLCVQEFCTLYEKHFLRKVLWLEDEIPRDRMEKKLEEKEAVKEREEEYDSESSLFYNYSESKRQMCGVQKWLAENSEEFKKNTCDESYLQDSSSDTKKSSSVESCNLLPSNTSLSIFESIKKRKKLQNSEKSGDSDTSSGSLKNVARCENGTQSKKGMGRGKLLLMNLSLLRDSSAEKKTKNSDNHCYPGSKPDEPSPSKSTDSLSKESLCTSSGSGRNDQMNILTNDKEEFEKTTSIFEKIMKEGTPIVETRSSDSKTSENCEKKLKSVGSASQETDSVDDKISGIIPRNSFGGVKLKLESELLRFQEGPRKSKLRDFWTPFVLFNDSPVEPVNTFKELPIHPSIIKNLRRQGVFNDLSPIQRWTIPTIRKQHNLVMIGSSKTGKTLSYIVPLIDFIQDRANFEDLPDGNGPYVVIICSSSMICESVYFMCHALLGNYSQEKMERSKIKIVLAHGGGREKEVWVELTNGCNILISTPHCLERLLEMPVLTNFARLSCLVLDEIDVISKEPFRNSVEVILEKAQFSTKDRYYQRIISGEKWTPEVESLVKCYVKSYALIISSYLEAAIYTRLKPKICIVSESQKPDILLDKIKDLIGVVKILIVCEKSSEAITLNDFLSQKGIHSLVAHENKMADDFKEIRTVWSVSTPHPILITTDGVLSEIQIRDVETLVHYSLPDKSKTNFFLRYSTFLENWMNKNRFQGTEKSSKLTDIVLVDDENHYQVPHIVDFVVRLGGNVPKKVLDKCDEIRRQIEIGKTDHPICTNFLAFGNCRTAKNCPRRHVFLKSLDSPVNLPTSGWVNFAVLKVHDPCAFSVRLLEHVDVTGKKSKIDDQYLWIHVKLAKFFESEDNRRSHGLPKIGDICAVKSEILEQDVFYRAQVVEFVKTDKYNQPVEVNVKLLDKGDLQRVTNMKLYELPDELSKAPPTAVEVRVAGIQPVDFDITWSQYSISLADDILTRDLEEDQYWSGKIVLSLNNILFLEPVKLKRFLPSVNTHVIDLNLQEEFLSNRIAVRNIDHISILYKFCTEGEIPVPVSDETKKDVPDVVEPQWAVFDSDFVRVKFLAAENTSTVFLQPKNFEKLLADLEVDCQAEAGRTIELQSSKKLEAHKLVVGMYCLALFEDSWNRGRIESTNEDNFYVFFVDHGDFHFVPKSNVIPISQNLLMRLPCQAIECNLAGIKSEKECLPLVLDEIYNFSNDGTQDLYAYITNKDLKPEITRGRKYGLNLLSLKGVSLNKALVDGERVAAEESEKEFLQDIEIEASDDEDDWDEVAGESESWSEVEGIDEAEEILEESDLAACFNKLPDDLFEDESARLFLKEFASKIFPQAVQPSSPQSSNLKPQISDGKNDKHTAELDDFEMKEGSDSDESSRKTPQKNHDEPKKTNSLTSLNSLKLIQRKRKEKHKDDLELRSEEGVLCPQVLWSQDHSEVQLKVMLTDVKDCRLDCSVTNLLFRCLVDQKLYEVDLKLYGAISPQMTKVIPKAHHVAIKLKKLVYPTWPRLQMDEGKHPWIVADVESILAKENFISEEIKSVKSNIEAGILKEGIRLEDIYFGSESEDEALSEDSNSE